MFNRITILTLLLCTLPLWAVAGTVQLPKTGQTESYAAGDDGDLERGVAWPGQRFTDNGNGTVTDNLTRLIWLKNANCTDTVGGVDKSERYITWSAALTWSNALASGACGLIDGSRAGQWRLPNINELHSLEPTWPPGTSFSSVQSDWYWSSTGYIFDPP